MDIAPEPGPCSRRVASPGAESVIKASSELVTKRESRQLLELYFGITDERLRRKLMEVAQLLKTTGDE